jgi:hypothetical protein
MEIISIILIVISAIAFLSYGISLFLSDYMKNEFVRFNLEKYRILVGLLEIFGGLGLIVGIIYNPVLIFSSAGLSILMLLGIWVRIKIKDGLLRTLPAILFMVLNFYILILAIMQ